MRNPDLFADARHLVIDLETFGTGPRAQILSIGAVLMEATLSESFYRLVDLGGHNAARAEDPDTVAWWQRQNREARMALTAAPRIPLDEALADLSRWAAPNEDLLGRVVAWGNGDDFDLAILADAYREVGRSAEPGSPLAALRPPWHYWRGMNLRTLAALFPHVAAPHNPNQKHIAVFDAQHEARHLRRLLAEWQAWRDLCSPPAPPLQAGAA